MNSLTVDEKIGQLFIIRSYSRGDKIEEKLILNQIEKFKVGGVCFFNGDPAEQVRLVNLYQKSTKTPLFIGLDAEWGPAMRFSSKAIALPKPMTLGAIQNDVLIYETGRQIARQCKAIGVNFNFAPSVDVNNNPYNPIIFDRSFGEDPINVTKKAIQYVSGMESEGVLSCIKHFPGHGDTKIDSHNDLPTLNFSKERLNSIELFPFRQLISSGTSAVMVGHLYLPQLEKRPNRPATLSDKLVEGILRDEMGFQGLVVTDAMDMKAVGKYFKPGLAEAEAFLAGNDIILLPSDLNLAYTTIKSYIQSGKISKQRLNESVYRVLIAKYKAGLNNFKPIEFNPLNNALNSNETVGLKQKLSEESLTLLKDEQNLLPIQELNRETACLSINVSAKPKFQQRINDFQDTRNYQFLSHSLIKSSNQMLTTLSQFKRVIVSFHTSGKMGGIDKEMPQEVIQFLKNLNQQSELIIVFFGNPYWVKKLDFAKTILLAYSNDDITQDVAAQSLFGVNNITGRLPVSINAKWESNYGIDKSNISRLGYAIPEMMMANSDTLKIIDKLFQEAINTNATPGGQVLVVKKGKIIYHKTFGTLGKNLKPVNKSTIYDIASVSKTLATTLATMKLYEQGKIKLHENLGRYLSEAAETDKQDIKVKDILAHHGQLLGGINFFWRTIDPSIKIGYNPKYYSGVKQQNYIIPVARGMFLKEDYPDTIIQMIFNSKKRDSQTYRYSDLGFILLHKIIENQSNTPMDEFLDRHFYSRLYLTHTTFNPIDKNFSMSQIAPTELDKVFRKQTIQGYVHDPTAALLGGVSGHAGLFSNAKEMAIIMQMLLNHGEYAGERFLDQSTIKLFTTRHERSTRRALGFDMKELDSSKRKNVSSLASPSIFGHTGFTGTAAWADPEHDLIYIITTNRTFSGSNSNAFNNKDYRTKIMSVIYKSFLHNVPNVVL